MIDETPIKFKSPANMKKCIDLIINDKMRDLGITSYLCPFILELSPDEGISHKELTERVCVNKSLTTRAMKVLFIEGYAENRNTGKEYSLYLTERGAAIKKEVKKKIIGIMESIFEDLTPEEREQMRNIDCKINDRLEKMISELRGSNE